MKKTNKKEINIAGRLGEVEGKRCLSMKL
jgi:hypothetical protein